MIHFLHIGKTGGTALRYALREVVESPFGAVKFHTHTTRLCDIPQGEKVVFFLREPLSRFYSSFYSRKRKGQPRYDSQWTDDEAIAFSVFDTPEQILDYAISGDVVLLQKALDALLSIGHIKDHYSYWLNSIEYLTQRKDDILYVGNIETLAHDFEQVKSLLDLPGELQLPTSDEQAHKNPSYQRTKLSSAQQAFFQGWFLFDYNMYEHLNTNTAITKAT